jgi:hypothetical protein
VPSARREAGHGAPGEPVRELRRGARKNHVIVWFDQPSQPSSEREVEWQALDRVEA